MRPSQLVALIHYNQASTNEVQYSTSSLRYCVWLNGVCGLDQGLQKVLSLAFCSEYSFGFVLLSEGRVHL